MSLASLLDRLGGLLPKYFIVGAFLPALIFGFLNGAIFYGDSAWFRLWSADLISASPKLFPSAVVLIGIAVAGYLISCVNTYLRELLEGKHFPVWMGQVQKSMEATQRQRYKDIQTAYQDARRNATRIAAAKRIWSDSMADWAVVGAAATTTSTYTGTGEDAAKLIEAMRTQERQADPISFEQLGEAVVALGAVLRTNSITPEPPILPNRLAEDRKTVLLLIDYALTSWSVVEQRKFDERSARFAPGGEIAPTTLGNIAASMRAYGTTRYGINLDTFWTRLQPLLASGNKDFYSGLQDSKTQLDFLIACCCLSALSTAVWLPLLAVRGTFWWLFLAVALGGPAASWLCYELAVETYVVFTELVRTSVDLYRFSLLQALHIGLPKGIRDERAVWNALRKLATDGREAVDLTYQHDPKGGNG